MVVCKIVMAYSRNKTIKKNSKNNKNILSTYLNWITHKVDDTLGATFYAFALHLSCYI